MTAFPLTERPQDTLTALERLEVLCDAGSLHVIRSEVTSRHMGAKVRAGDGVVGGAGMVEGRPVFCYAQDSSYVGGSLGEAHADTIVRVMRLARRAQAPIVGFVSSGGARMQEGSAGLSGYGRIFRETVQLSGKVPQISVITGLSAGGGAYAPALTDWVVMTRDSSMFLTGPNVVRDALGELHRTLEIELAPRIFGPVALNPLPMRAYQEVIGVHVRDLLAQQVDRVRAQSSLALSPVAFPLGLRELEDQLEPLFEQAHPQ